MPNPFHELRERLLIAGVAPRHVRRYLAELADHLADLKAEERRAGRTEVEAESAALLRLGGIEDLCRAMTEQRQFQSWSSRLPWATFGLLPLLLLSASYFVACFILWSGWRIFLPAATTPFVPIHGLAILYFGIGRWIYYDAPILVGWVIAIAAARQRSKSLWPAVGLIPIAWMGSAAQVHATRAVLPAAIGHVSMSFSFLPFAHALSNETLHALLILSLTLLPFLIWRWLKLDSLFA